MVDGVRPEPSWRFVAKPELVARLFDSRPALPIILMSAYSTDELRTRGLDHSPVPLLTKPFTNEQLVVMVRPVLDVSAAS